MKKIILLPISEVEYCDKGFTAYLDYTKYSQCLKLQEKGFIFAEDKSIDPEENIIWLHLPGKERIPTVNYEQICIAIDLVTGSSEIERLLEKIKHEILHNLN